MNFDDLLSEYLTCIEQRLADVELEYMEIAGNRLAKIAELSAEQVRDYMYSGKAWEDESSDRAKIKRALAAAHKANIRELVKLLKEIVKQEYTKFDTLRQQNV